MTTKTSCFLKQHQPFISEYFEATLTTIPPRLANAYLLCSSDVLMSYYTALEIGKILNCKCNKSIDYCSCQNGKWISDNKHPAIITVSPIDFKYNENGAWNNKKSDNIKIDQIRYLRNFISSTSDYHRIVIFTDAEENTQNNAIEIFNDKYKTSLNFPAIPQFDKDEKRISWTPKPLNKKILREEAANSLLKTIEEPNSKITFFFISQDKEDLIETIVSRCCTLNLINKNKEFCTINPEIEEIIREIPLCNYARSLELAEKSYSLIKDNIVSQDVFFDSFLTHLKNMLRKNYDTPDKFNIIKNWIENTENTRHNLKNYISLQPALEYLFESFLLNEID